MQPMPVVDHQPPWPDPASPWRRAVAGLLLMLAVVAALAAATIAWRLAAGDPLKLALQSTSALQARTLVHPSGNDSWGAMLAALHRAREAQPGSVYQRTLDLDRCKFQYPPASLLPLMVGPTPAGPVPCAEASPGGREGAVLDAARWPLKPWVDAALWLATLAQVAVALLVLRQVLGPTHRRGLRTAGLALLALGLSCYPLLNGWVLGQVQVLLNLCSALALLAVLRGRPALAGVLLGLCCLVKPQWVLMLLWAGLRREWRLAGAMLAVAVVGHGIGVAVFGWGMHADYAAFLRDLAGRGEAYWANQSVNGLLNRWFELQDPRRFVPDAFPPPNDWVRWGTLLSSALILAITLWRPAAPPATAAGIAAPEPSPEQRALDFGAMLAAMTLASPVAWPHHHAALLPLCALMLAVLARQGASRRAMLWLGGAYVLMAHEWLREDLYFASREFGLLASHLLVGALLTWGLLLRMRRAAAARPV